MKQLSEPKNSLLTIKYSPNDEILKENPPRFTWIPADDEDLPYKLQISTSKDFSDERVIEIESIPYNFYTPDYVFEPGKYYWRYSLDIEEAYNYSEIRSFTIAAETYKTPLISRKERYVGADMSHPRIWLNKEKIITFRENLSKDENYLGFKNFYNNSIEKYKGKTLVAEPLPYPENKRVVHLWRQNYMDCQEALLHIRSLAVGGILLEDESMIAGAKIALLTLAKWDVKGSTGRNYNDECAFRVVYALAFGYDWLYDYLSEAEKEQVRVPLYLRTKQVADHIMIDSRIHFSLYDSHAVRSLSSVLTPCCIAMLGENEDANKWLDYTIEYFNTIYTPWGGLNGGWAEGPMYWTSGMAFLIDALNTIKNFTGIDIYKRPFFQKTGDFIAWCNPADTYRTSFCDQSNLGQYPGHKTAANMRQFAGVTGNKMYKDYYDAVFKREPEIEDAFYNNGWWDFNFDDMVYHHDYRDVEYSKGGEVSGVKHFADIGWVSINKNIDNPEEHLFFLTKSSPYGSVSHSHGDQNSFLLQAYGEPLVIRSGHYIGFNTSMHRDWRRQTKSHNSILINGQGQYAEMDKAKQLMAKGHVCEVSEKENHIYIKENATAAYRENVSYIKDYTREIYFVENEYFVIVDSIELENNAEIDWKLHSLYEYILDGDKFTTQGEKAKLSGKFVYCSSGVKAVTKTDEFEGVNPEEIKGLDKEWHLSMITETAKNHVLVTLLIPSKAEEKKIVTAIKDDQGHDVYFYFNYDGKVFSLRTDGNKRY